MKAAIYARVSTEEQARRETIENQLYECRRYCEREGWEVLEEVKDEGVSGTVPFSERTGGKRLLELATSREIDRVVILKADRFARDSQDVTGYNTLFRLLSPGSRRRSKAEVAWSGEGEKYVHFVHQNFDDTPAGELMFTMFLAIAKYERSVIRERTMAGRQRRIREGKHQAPVTAYGYKYIKETGTVELDLAQAAIVKQMFEWADEGIGAKEIGNRLDEQGVKSPLGNRRKLATEGWSEGTIAKQLKAPRYYGQGSYGDQEMLYPPIISKELFDRVQQSRSARKRDSKRGTKEFYLLQHLIYCRRCGSMYHSEYNAAGTKRYCCGRRRANARREGERHKDIRWSFVAAELDEEIKLQIGWLMAAPERFFTNIDSQLKGEKAKLSTVSGRVARLESELAALDQKETRFISQQVGREMSESQLTKMLAAFEEARDKLTRDLEKARAETEGESARERVEFLQMIADMRGKRLPVNVELEADERGQPRYVIADRQSESPDIDDETWFKWIRQFVSRIWAEQDGSFTLEGPGELLIRRMSLDMQSQQHQHIASAQTTAIRLVLRIAA